MWELYDKLIAEISEEERVEEVIAGLSWTATRSKAMGLAMSFPRPLELSQLPGTCMGQSVKSLAERIKSWNSLEAAIGLSAINSVRNCRETIADMENKGYKQLQSGSAFDLFADKIRGKKVAVIGHFPDVCELSKHCQLSVLERNPQMGDLPDPAAEYILSEQDYVFMTSSTLINKTTPRLLELSKNAVTIMLGPSTPFSTALFEMGVNIISGLVVEEEDFVLRCIKEGGGVHSFRNAVQYINISKSVRSIF